MIEIYKDELSDRDIPLDVHAQRLLGEIEKNYYEELKKEVAGQPNQLYEPPNFGVIEQLGVRFVDCMIDTLKECSYNDVQNIYKKCAAQLMVSDANYKDTGAFYRAGEGIYINKEKVAEGSLIHKPYQVAFHEFGHNIDYIMGGGEPISEKWGNNVLYDAIRRDYETLKGERSVQEFISDLRKEVSNRGLSMMDTASVSDILESLTGVSYPLGCGHGKDYWNNRLPNKEFFAEVLDGAVANEGSYSVMNEFFPNAVKIVHQIIGGNI